MAKRTGTGIQMQTSFKDQDLLAILEETVRIALKASLLIMPRYEAYKLSSKSIKKDQKSDGSVVTDIDRAASDLIVSELQAKFPGILIISEENDSDKYDTEQPVYITIDPVDGTEELLNMTDGFSTKIALVENGTPLTGVSFCPAQGILYSSMRGGPAWRQEHHQAAQEIKTKAFLNNPLKTLFNSRYAPFSNYGLVRKTLEDKGIVLPTLPDCSPGLPRALRVAEGLADVFVRCSKDPRMIRGSGASWDYASDWIILKNAGGVMLELETGHEITFPVPRAPVKPFIALGNPALGKKIFP